MLLKQWTAVSISRVQFGLNVPPFGEYGDARLLAELAVDAENAGWDGFWIWDHIQWSGEDDGEPRTPAVDTTVALSLIAAATTRIRFGPMVMPLARRRPWKVARELTTLDHVSAGRLTVGVGLGALPGLEFADFGEDTDAGVRAGRLDEGLEVLAGLWSGQPYDHDGPYYRLTNAEMLPAPVQTRIPIWVGGSWPQNRAPFRRAARFDGVYPLLYDVALADQPGAIKDLRTYIQRHQADRTRPFDVIYGVETAAGADPDDHGRDHALVAAFAAAGVTWWMEPISRDRGPLTAVRDRIRQGPPRPAA